MSKVIDLKSKSKEHKVVAKLIELAKEYDELSIKYLTTGTDIRDVAGIMANRLGELIRVFEGDKEALEGMIYGVIHERAYLDDNL